MNSDKLAAKVARAIRMKEWAHGDDGLFAVFDAVERDYLAALKDSGPEEAAFRETVYHRIKAFADVRRVMEAVIADGASAQAIMAEFNKIAERKASGKKRVQRA